jgi:hypothetical protein
MSTLFHQPPATFTDLHEDQAFSAARNSHERSTQLWSFISQQVLGKRKPLDIRAMRQAMAAGDKVNQAFAMGKKPSQIGAVRNAEVTRRVQAGEEEAGSLVKMPVKRQNTRSPEKVRGG